MQHTRAFVRPQAIHVSSASRGRIKASTGFMPRSQALHRAYNLALSSLLFLLVLPLFVTVSIALLMTQGRSIFYFGPRLGRNMRPFHIIKFRSLDGEKAKALTRNGVLPPDSGIETPLGGFLRETRLDELPQLLNVIRGDMNLCGPRPVRPEIAAIYRREIPDYDQRFEVKPGLVGHTQAYMNHGTSKAIRARYNAILVRSPVNYLNEIAMVFLVGFCVLARGARHSWRLLQTRFSRRADDASVERARLFRLFFTPDASTTPIRVHAIDEACVWFAPGVLGAHASENGAVSGRLTMRLPDGKIRTARIALARFAEDGGDSATFRYRPASDFAYHVISRYLLQKVVVPHKSHLPITPVITSVSRIRRRARRVAPLSPARAPVQTV